MNLVGKIFTVLIFVLSLVFMSFAVAVYATHKNWRTVVQNTDTAKGKLGLEKQLEQQKDVNKQLNEQLGKEKQTYESEKTLAQQVRAKLETERNEAVKERDALLKQDEDYGKQLRKEVAEVKAAHQELETKRAENETLRTEIRNAQTDRDKHFAQVVKVTDDLHQAANELARLKELNKNLAEQHAKAMEVLRLHGLKAEPELYRNVPPMVEGLVTATPSEGIVEISIGADDGLLPGHQLFVYRATGAVNSLVGKIEVVKTAPDRAVCKSLRGEWNKSTIVKGDRVATQIK